MQLAQSLTIERDTDSGGAPHLPPPLSQPSPHASWKVWVTVVVAGLGYFVDVIDLWLFSNFRVASLKELGLSGAEITSTGAYLINCQQAGLLLGGVLWGVLGDKRGRSSVMFGSILLYSVANILNAFVQTVPTFAALRFITGIGLAGEIGAGITLICEILPKHQRGIGTTIMTGLGVTGAIVAALMGKYLEWRVAFLIGGIMGLSLLFLRMMTHDSSMFQKMVSAGGVKRGSLTLLFGSRRNLVRFVSCVVIGTPIFLTMGIFATFSHEIASALGISDSISIADVLLVTSIGMTVGDLGAGALSQMMQRRKLPLGILLGALCIIHGMMALGLPRTETTYLILAGLAGVCGGYWACLLTTSAEQFGTNIRATVTTMIPNLVRATAIPLTSGFVALKGSFSMQETLLILVGATFMLAFTGLALLKETFHRDLDFYER